MSESRFAHTSAVVLLAVSLITSGMPGLAYADPAQPNPSKAREQGRADGNPDGRREGNERGRDEGRRRGEVEGYREGYAYCERQEMQRHYDLGYRAGYRDGEVNGDLAGHQQGETEGRDSGIREGTADGRRRADADARAAATPLGAAQGVKEANASDAVARGEREGTIKGDEQARETARRVDYPRGRQSYRDEQYASPVEHQDAFAQKSADGVGEGAGLGSWESVWRDGGVTIGRDGGVTIGHPAERAVPDYRYYNPRKTYPHPSENDAYRDGYRTGYNQGFNSTYTLTYNQEYRLAYRYAYDRGCIQAKAKNYQYEYDRGYREGRARGYEAGYKRAYDAAYRVAYDREFRPASEAAYRELYPVAYDRHFEAARSEAYARRYKELYDAAFEQARALKYNAVYPGYAREEYERGRRDEAEDFRQRPLRLLDAEITETIENGVYEPGEALHVRLKARNFAAEALAGRDVRVSVQALDAQSAVIAVGEETLSRDLRSRSVTDVSRLLLVRLNPVAAGKATRFVVRVSYKGREGGEKTVTVEGNYMLDLRFAETPVFSEGMAAPVRLRVRNRSNASVPAGTRIEFRSNPEILEVLTPAVEIGALAAGEETLAEFSAIARKPGQAVAMPIVFGALEASTGRQIGSLDLTGEFPVLNDYTVRITTDLAQLRREGIVRVEYVVKNVSSRLTFQPLQLTIRVAGEEDVFTVIGPNPQLLAPLLKNQQAVFVVPVHASRANDGGELELEVRENGSTVVIHRAKF